jgi:hypothetical protein
VVAGGALMNFHLIFKLPSESPLRLHLQRFVVAMFWITNFFLIMTAITNPGIIFPLDDNDDSKAATRFQITASRDMKTIIGYNGVDEEVDNVEAGEGRDTASSSSSLEKSHTREKLAYCDTCKIACPASLKVQHCDDCGYCIEKLDHHCPWMGQCVGRYNMK